jgi:2-amino-4-hydroxy-6-hydroxymethyldihydropteridine diphosphokinase
MAIAYIALGSNLGDRRALLDRALQALRDQGDLVVRQVSRFQETVPVGGPPGQADYLNAVAELETPRSPEDLLQTLLEIERSLGRVREVPNGPRAIDLDLLLYGDLIRQSAELTLPHPRMHERLFVLRPLAELAPHVVHPVLGHTVQELLDKLLARWPAGRELTGLRSLVTGSTSGIGRAIALELAAAGANVLVHGRRAERAETVVAQIQAAGVQSGMVLADLRHPEECAGLVDRAWSQWKGLDIWINNAGADTLTGDAAGWSFPDKLSELWAVDVLATVQLARDAGGRMKMHGGGVLLNMGWDQAEYGMEGDSGQLFAATKGAVMAFSKSLAVSLAPQVRVNCLAPGWIRTAWGESASNRWQERVQRETPLGRWGTPADVAAAARWLVSPAAAYLTGQTIRINGGAVR